MQHPTAGALHATTYVIDFETYYDSVYSLSKMTTEEYIRSPLFEVIMVGVVSVCSNGAGTAPTISKRVFRPDEFKQWAATVPWDQVAVLAHHAQFDGRILAYHYGIFPGFWYDTLSMGRALHGINVSGSLANLMKLYQVGVKGSTVHDMKGRSYSSLSNPEWDRYAAYCLNDCEGALAILQHMLAGTWPAKGGFPRWELDHIDVTVRMFTEPVLVLNEAQMQAYYHYEVRRKQELLAELQIEKTDLMSDRKFAELLLEQGVVPPMKWSAKKHCDIYSFAKTDSGMQALLEYSAGSDEQNTAVQALAEARLAHKSTINVTRSERLIRLGNHGAAMPVYLKYAGAHTHRWSGGDGMNWQNFERTMKDNFMRGMIRQCIEAPPGWALVVCDSAQIEARVLAWLAEQLDLVEAFAQKRDVYSEMGTVIYGRPIDRKKVAADEVPGQVSKVAVLGLGYGMGWFKFAATLLAGAMGAAPIQFTQTEADSMGVSVSAFSVRKGMRGQSCGDIAASLPSRLSEREKLVHCAVACHIVDVYRKKNAEIVAFWAACDEMLGMMCSLPEGEHTNLGCISIIKHGIILPSGLILHYPEVHFSEASDGYVYRNRYGFTKLYGGLLCENITQALARVVVSDQIHPMVAEQGYKVANMTHDEVMLCVPEQIAQEALDFALKSMKTAPDWAAGLPLNAEGGFGKVYGEIK